MEIKDHISGEIVHLDMYPHRLRKVCLYVDRMCIFTDEITKREFRFAISDAFAAGLLTSHDLDPKPIAFSADDEVHTSDTSEFEIKLD